MSKKNDIRNFPWSIVKIALTEGNESAATCNGCGKKTCPNSMGIMTEGNALSFQQRYSSCCIFLVVVFVVVVVILMLVYLFSIYSRVLDRIKHIYTKRGREKHDEKEKLNHNNRAAPIQCTHTNVSVFICTLLAKWCLYVVRVCSTISYVYIECYVYACKQNERKTTNRDRIWRKKRSRFRNFSLTQL